VAATATLCDSSPLLSDVAVSPLSFQVFFLQHKWLQLLVTLRIDHSEFQCVRWLHHNLMLGLPCDFAYVATPCISVYFFLIWVGICLLKRPRFILFALFGLGGLDDQFWAFLSSFLFLTDGRIEVWLRVVNTLVEGCAAHCSIKHVVICVLRHIQSALLFDFIFQISRIDII